VFYRISINAIIGGKVLSDLAEKRKNVLASDRAIDMACQHALENLEGRITLTDLEVLAGVSARNLQYGFMRKYGCSPMKWVRNERLNLAQRHLSNPEQGTSVTSVATALGFSNLGLFSRYYKEKFGELPSQTLMHSLRSV